MKERPKQWNVRMIVEKDVVIIGAGPIGLFSIFQCGMLGLSTSVFEALEHSGGQCQALYPEKPIYDIPAYPSLTGAELIKQLECQAHPFQPEIHLGSRIQNIELQDDGRWSVQNTQGVTVRCRAVLITAGGGCFQPQRPPLPHIEDFEGTSVFYSIQNKDFLKDKRVVIAGGGDSAVDWALQLIDFAQNVVMIHRRPQFRAAEASQNHLQHAIENQKIRLITPYQLTALHGHQQQLTHIDVASLKQGDPPLSIPTDILLPFFGLKQEKGPWADWGLETEKNKILVNPTTQQTSKPGFYAAGDICTYTHKLPLILCGFSEAAMAVHHIRDFLNPGRAFHFEHSTTQGVPSLTHS